MSTIKVNTLTTLNGSGNITVSRPLAGSGASLTALNATELTSGTIPIARIADDAITLAKMADDAIGVAQLSATGTASNSVFLRGDNTWATAGSTSASDLTSGTLPMARLSGTLPALNGSALTNIPSTPVRNFIIDGDFTQWPEGTTVTAPSSNDYGPALWHASLSGGHVFNYVKETSILPTLAQSGHSSKQCMKIDVTTAESSVASGDRFLLDYVITGTDYQRLEGQEVTLSFWVRSGLTGTFYVTFKNGNDNRFYMSAQTINAVNTWEKKTITLTLDTAGGATWLYTEADQGLTIRITLMSGTDRQDSGAVNTWLNGASKDSKSDQTNFLSDTSKDFYLSQVGLYLGSTAPDFTSPPISTVQDQVQYYVESFNKDIEGSPIHLGTGVFVSSTQLRAHVPFATRKRVAPTMTSSTSMSPAHFSIQYGASGSDVTSINGLMHVSTVSFVFAVTHGPTVSGGEAGQLRVQRDGGWVLADARH